MEVKLVTVTPEPEKIVVYCARVSNPQNQDNPEYAKLVRYLINNKHWSPFEHAFMTVEIKTSMPIGEQILRHRSFGFQKFSGRYSEFVDMEPVELRKQAEKNRQSTTEIFDPIVELLGMPLPASVAISQYMALGLDLYRQLLNAEVGKECARFILPMATQTTMYMTGSARSWVHYLAIRTDEHVQKEHRLVAEAIKAIFIQQFPVTAEALGWNQ